MASCAASKLQMFMFKYLKFLYKKCPGGNYHKRWDRLCWCRVNESDGEWHGGVLDFKTGKELIPYETIEATRWHEKQRMELRQKLWREAQEQAIVRDNNFIADVVKLAEEKYHMPAGEALKIVEKALTRSSYGWEENGQA